MQRRRLRGGEESWPGEKSTIADGNEKSLRGHSREDERGAALISIRPIGCGLMMAASPAQA